MKRATARKAKKSEFDAAAAAAPAAAAAAAIAGADTSVAPTATGDASPSEVTRASKKAKLFGLVVVWVSRYPSHGNSGRNAENDRNTNLSAKKKASTADQHDQL